MNDPVLGVPPVDWPPVTPGGRLMIWPICKVVGLTPGFAASTAATVVLKLAAIVVNVSPAFIVYVAPDAGGVGAGGVGTGAGTLLDGTLIEAPI